MSSSSAIFKARRVNGRLRSAATERAKAAELILSLFTRYDQLHFERLGGLDSNHCLHLFNHFRPKIKKMINKWETYNPIALHRTYERLHKQTQQFVTPDQLAHMSFEGLFDALHESELAPPAMLTSSESCGVEGAGSLSRAARPTAPRVRSYWSHADGSRQLSARSVSVSSHVIMMGASGLPAGCRCPFRRPRQG